MKENTQIDDVEKARIIMKAKLENWFECDVDRYKAIREAGTQFAQVVVDNTETCADQTVVLRKIREAIMFANASATCKVYSMENKRTRNCGLKESEIGENLDRWFVFRALDESDLDKYRAIIDGARHFAQVIAENTPENADQVTALRKIREIVITAAISIGCNGWF